MAGRTPNIDKLAAEGVLLTDYYARAFFEYADRPMKIMAGPIGGGRRTEKVMTIPGAEAKQHFATEEVRRGSPF
jgi:hypothetical protein